MKMFYMIEMERELKGWKNYFRSESLQSIRKRYKELIFEIRGNNPSVFHGDVTSIRLVQMVEDRGVETPYAVIEYDKL